MKEKKERKKNKEVFAAFIAFQKSAFYKRVSELPDCKNNKQRSTKSRQLESSRIKRSADREGRDGKERIWR